MSGNDELKITDPGDKECYDLTLECDDQHKPQKGNSMGSGCLIPTIKISNLGSGNQPLAEEYVKIANTGFWKVTSNYIKELLEKSLQSKSILDTRVYVCFYSTPPTGHDIKYLDVNIEKVETRKKVKTLAPNEVSVLVTEMKTNSMVFDPGGDC